MVVAKEGFVIVFFRATGGGVGLTSRSADVLGCTAGRCCGRVGGRMSE